MSYIATCVKRWFPRLIISDSDRDWVELDIPHLPLLVVKQKEGWLIQGTSPSMLYKTLPQVRAALTRVLRNPRPHIHPPINRYNSKHVSLEGLFHSVYSMDSA